MNAMTPQPTTVDNSAYLIFEFEQGTLSLVEFEWPRDGFIIASTCVQRFTIGFRPKWNTLFGFDDDPRIAGTFIFLYLNCEWRFVGEHIKWHERNLFGERIMCQRIVHSNLNGKFRKKKNEIQQQEHN